MHARAHVWIAAALLVGLGGTARADEKPDSGRAFESELGLAMVYSNTDLVSLGGFVGFSLGKPILDVFYLEPVLHAEFGLWNAGRLTGLLRCNFVTSVGTVVSLGFGAGTGWKTVTTENPDYSTEDHTVYRDHREVEVAVKKGGKRRFLIGLALAFDTDEMGVESKAIMLQTTIVRAAP